MSKARDLSQSYSSPRVFASVADMQSARIIGGRLAMVGNDLYKVGASDLGYGLALANGLYANRIQKTITVSEYGYDNAGITAAVAAVKELAGALADQYPSDEQVTLHFPSGRYNTDGALIDITLGATGFNVTGEGFTSQLDNIQIIMNGAYRCSIMNFFMRGALGHGIKSNSNGSNLSRQNVFSNLYIRDKTSGVIIDGSAWNMWSNVFVEKSSGDGWAVLDTLGEQVSGCYSVSNSGRGLYIQKGGEFKTSGFSSHNNVGYGVHLYGDDVNNVVENYFEGLTSTIQQRFRLLTITSIVTHADGIQVTTSDPHQLAADMTDIKVTNTTNYDGTFNVVSVVDSTNFTLDATYVSNEISGDIDLPNWDLVIESDSAQNYKVNDQFFSGGNLNYTKVKGYNIRFDDVRLKQQFYVESPSNLVFRKGGARGRQSSTFDDVVTSGITTGVFESIISDNNGSSVAGTASMRFTGGGNELSVGPSGTKGTALYSGNTGSMADDTVYSFTPPTSKGTIKVTNGLGQAARVIDVVFDTVAGSTTLAGYQGAAINQTSGVLTGTTGTDTFITVSAASDGKVYLENRNGTQTIWWTIFR